MFLRPPSAVSEAPPPPLPPGTAARQLLPLWSLTTTTQNVPTSPHCTWAFPSPGTWTGVLSLGGTSDSHPDTGRLEAKPRRRSGCLSGEPEAAAPPAPPPAHPLPVPSRPQSAWASAPGHSPPVRPRPCLLAGLARKVSIYLDHSKQGGECPLPPGRPGPRALPSPAGAVPQGSRVRAGLSPPPPPPPPHRSVQSKDASQRAPPGCVRERGALTAPRRGGSLARAALGRLLPPWVALQPAAPNLTPHPEPLEGPHSLSSKPAQWPRNGKSRAPSAGEGPAASRPSGPGQGDAPEPERGCFPPKPRTAEAPWAGLGSVCFRRRRAGRLAERQVQQQRG